MSSGRMSSVMGALLLRRDANRARRAGTGRQTTKRAFTIALPKAGHFTSGAAAISLSNRRNLIPE